MHLKRMGDKAILLIHFGFKISVGFYILRKSGANTVFARSITKNKMGKDFQKINQFLTARRTNYFLSQKK